MKPRRKCRFNLVTGEYDELFRFELYPRYVMPTIAGWGWHNIKPAS